MSSISNRYGCVSIIMNSALTSDDSVYFNPAGTLFINLDADLKTCSSSIINDYVVDSANGDPFYVSLKPASYTGFSSTGFHHVSMIVKDST